MAKTLAIGSIPHAFGVGRKIAIGTVLAVNNVATGVGSFSILDASGSKAMRNIEAVVLQPFSGSLVFNASGSTDGYIAVSSRTVQGTSRDLGTWAGTSQIVCSFMAIGGAGSI
jgi:hypothetical protein